MTRPARKPELRVSQFAIDGCFRSFQAGISPTQLVAELGIDPTIVLHCYELFLDEPYAHGDRPGDRGRPIHAPLRFAPDTLTWQRAHDIPGSIAAWFQAAVAVVSSIPVLRERSISRGQAIKHDPEPFAAKHGLRGDSWLLAVFEIVSADEALLARCLAKACELERVATLKQQGLS